MRISSPLRAIHGPALSFAALMTLGCSSESTPSGNENVEVQVGTHDFYQELWGNNALAPAATLTGPFNSATFALTYTGDPTQLHPDSTKKGWHKYKFFLADGNTVTLRVASPAGGGILFERSCTVHPRALAIEYVEFLTYGAEFKDDGFGNILPPGPDAQCGCGFVEYGDQRNANQCAT